MANRRFFTALTAVLGTAFCVCLLLESQVAWSANLPPDQSPYTSLSVFDPDDVPSRFANFADFDTTERRRQQQEAIMKEVERSRLEAKKRKKRIIAGVTGAIAGLALLVLLGAAIRWRKSRQSSYVPSGGEGSDLLNRPPSGGGGGGGPGNGTSSPDGVENGAEKGGKGPPNDDEDAEEGGFS